MLRVIGLILVLSLCMHACVASPLSELCSSSDSKVDSTFKPCRSREIALPGPRDVETVTFTYAPDAEVTATIYVRAVVGTVSVVAVSGGLQIWDADTVEGPAIVKLTSSSSLEDGWTLHISNTYGTPSKFTLQVAVGSITTVANAATKAAVASIYKECCNASADFMFSSQPMPCDLLERWSAANATTPQKDVCQHGENFCSADGALQMLVLHSRAVVDFNSTAGNVVPAFNRQCSVKPPAGLAQLVDLVHLELWSCRLEWTVADIVAATSNMTKLERLDLGFNAIQGQLDAASCGLFKGKNLTAVSFRNAVTRLAPPWNAISGPVHKCWFASPLQSLNLLGNQVSSIGPIPVGSSPMRNLRLSGQMDPKTGVPTMLGTGWLQGLRNLKALELLGLGGNQLGGPLVLDVPDSLQWLDASGNNLSGSMPTLRTGSKITVLYMDGNPNLQADISKIGLTNAPGLLVLDLSNTSLYGDVSSVDWKLLSNLEYLKLSSTKLEGAVAPGLATLPQLQFLDLSQNPGITSQLAFADSLTVANNITYYDVSNCCITDLPDGLRYLEFFRADASTLQDNAWAFNISRNRIIATLPSWLAAPMQEPLKTRQAFTQDTVYQFAIQTVLDATLGGNHIGCPWQPLSNGTVADAAALQESFPVAYAEYVNCYNGSDPVPVASYLLWLKANGPMPAPPPPPGAQQPDASKGNSTAAASSTGATMDYGPSPGVMLAIAVGVVLHVALSRS